MRMLRKISGNTKKDMIQNKEICLKIGVIDEIMRETGKLLKMVWFGHIQQRAINASKRKSELIPIEGRTNSGRRPNITLKNQ